MSNIKIIQGDFAKDLELHLAPAIKAGFPSPAEDYLNDSLDFNRDLIRHPEARAHYPDSSLADLYDDLTMPADLRKAHQDNDRAVMAAYGWKASSQFTESCA